ncbi:MAG TPA: ABC transporter ATP-binding protein [Streptomyces sp.]|nr:ABC transporter ATP-binding protein [Streptomyces sp.]
MDAIEVEGLKRRYSKGFEAVRGVSFSVREGEIFALLGTNGAGKTSTVELLEGLAKPSGGKVRVLGFDPYSERSAVRPRTGVMLQEGGFPSELTVTETVRMWAGCTSDARPIGDVLEQVGLSGRRAEVRVKQLSGGERRRLDLAMALIGRPEVLFLDEPTTGMDPEGRRDTWELVRELRTAGTTVLLTTHYLEEAEALADRLAIMRSGRIVTTGTHEQVVAERPSSIRFTLPEGLRLETLPRTLPAPTVDARQRVEIRTPQLQTALTDLLLWARQAGVELPGLHARTATLEEVFLEIAQEPDEDDEAGASGNQATDQGGASPEQKEVERV